MSPTTGEANAINTLISALTGTPHPGSTLGLPPDADQTKEAVVLLASRAHRAIECGWDGPTAALAVGQLYATGRETAGQALASLAERDGGVVTWERRAAAAVVARCDGDELLLDGREEWVTDAVDIDQDGDEQLLTFTHPSGRQVLARVSVRLVGGCLT